MLTRHRFAKLLFACITLCSWQANATTNDKQAVVIFAAASLSNAISELALRYEQQTGIRIKKSFASSSVLAKQIQRGAPADLYLSADQRWMDHLAQQRLIQPNSRQDLLGNRLALIVAKQAPQQQQLAAIAFNRQFAFAQAFSGKLCTGQVDTVPIGRYAKQALQQLGWWPTIKPRIVGAQNVRTALAYVERGECGAGIVYATDGLIAKKANIVGLFPAHTHQAIRYPLALTKHANQHAAQFKAFLNSDIAKQVFTHYGFSVLTPANPVQ